MKILYLIPLLYHRAGMERTLSTKVNWLAEHTDYNITILTTEDAPDGEAVSGFTIHPKVRIMEAHIRFDDDFALSLPLKWWRHQQKIRHYRRYLQQLQAKEHFDCMISLGGKELEFLYREPWPVLVELHFSITHRKHLLQTFHSGWFYSMLGDIRVKQLIHDLRFLPKIVVLTEEEKQVCLQAGCKQVMVIPNPCPLSDSGVASNFETNPPIVLGVGRLHPEKGWSSLIQAFAMIANQHPQALLRIVGNGAEQAYLQELIHELKLDKRAQIITQCMDVEREYRGSRVLVLSSRSEGLPVTLIEGMWSGIPCVSFDCPTGPRALLDEGRGILVPPGDIASLAQAIDRALTAPQDLQAMTRQAQLWAKEHFSLEVIMPQWIQLLKEICK